jgi:Protein of unknown function (DUF1565)
MAVAARILILLLLAAAACGFPRPADVGDDASDPGVTVHVSGTGDDANDGLIQPVKTLKRAIALAGTSTEITTISLAAGRYTAATGETFPYMVPANVTIAGPATGGAILTGTKAEAGLTVDTGRLQDLDLEDFTVAITATGMAHLSDIHVRTSKLALRGETMANLMVDNLDITGAVDVCGSGIELVGAAELVVAALTTRNLITTLDAKDLSTINISKGDIVGDSRCQGYAFVISTSKAFTLSDSIVIGTYSGIVLSGMSSSPLHATLNNTILRDIRSLVLQGTWVVFTMAGGEISHNSVGIADARNGTWSLTDVKIQQNTGEGIYISGGGAQSLGILRMRGCIVTGNRDGVSLFDWSVADLGTSASPGGNIFQNNQFAGVSVGGLYGPQQVDAVGNTWNAGVQGADAAGQYPAPETVVGPVAQAAGNNYDIWSGLSLRR